MFAFSKVFGCLRVSIVLNWEEIRHVDQLFLIKILRRTHHRLMLVSTEIALNMLHIDEIGSLSRVSDTSSCA